MKAIIWIIILALVVWAIWWFARGNNTAGIPNTATDTSTGQVEGSSDSYTASSTDNGSGAYDSKG
ncbi:hypothetical protein KW784_01580 [Candidatus Parcubacteria bacterium]|nr:hypothetical protein [Candidatus Parcubacteria bacterium]